MSYGSSRSRKTCRVGSNGRNVSPIFRLPKASGERNTGCSFEKKIVAHYFVKDTIKKNPVALNYFTNKPLLSSRRSTDLRQVSHYQVELQRNLTP